MYFTLTAAGVIVLAVAVRALFTRDMASKMGAFDWGSLAGMLAGSALFGLGYVGVLDDSHRAGVERQSSECALAGRVLFKAGADPICADAQGRLYSQTVPARP